MKRSFLTLSLMACIALCGAEDEEQFLQPNIASVQNVHYAMGIGCSRINRTTEGCKIAGLKEYLSEVAHALRPGEEGFLISDSNYHILFTAKDHSEEKVKEHISAVLTTIKDVKNEREITEGLLQLTEVYRATFIEKEGRLLLVDNKDMLQLGDQIWRKSEGNVEKGYYHDDIECLQSLQEAGLFCTEVKRPHFFGNVKYKLYHNADSNRSLGAAYIHNHPFTIYTFVKQ